MPALINQLYNHGYPTVDQLKLLLGIAKTRHASCGT